MSEASGTRQRGERAPSGDAWERRAADVVSGVQRWLIRTSARNMRDELGGQVRKAFGGSAGEPGDVWATATTEPAGAAQGAPECEWCPVCRAARRLAQARQGAAPGGAGPAGAGAPLAGVGAPLAGAAGVMAGAVREALAGLDAILSYRPQGTGGHGEGAGEPGDEPSHRG